MNVYDFLFYLFAAVTLLSAFFVVTIRNIIYSAYFLLFTFFGVAGIYVLLGADFVAIVQLIVYVGGILILLLFGVMLTNKITSVDIKTGAWQIIPSAIGVALFAAFIISALTGTNWKNNPAEAPAQTTIFNLGMLLMNEYIVVFELLGILLLVALVGAASLARTGRAKIGLEGKK